MLVNASANKQPSSLHPVAEVDIDPETADGPARFEDALDKRSHARSLRFDSALALFEVAVAEDPSNGPIPSPAKFVAQVLRKAARASDVIARVSPGLFAVLLIEAHGEGAKQFTERVRTGIGSNPYARRLDGSGLFARAWAGVALWDPSFDSVEAYAGAAEKALSSTFRGYEAAQEWFRGEGLNKPFMA